MKDKCRRWLLPCSIYVHTVHVPVLCVCFLALDECINFVAQAAVLLSIKSLEFMSNFCSLKAIIKLVIDLSLASTVMVFTLNAWPLPPPPAFAGKPVYNRWEFPHSLYHLWRWGSTIWAKDNSFLFLHNTCQFYLHKLHFIDKKFGKVCKM